MFGFMIIKEADSKVYLDMSIPLRCSSMRLVTKHRVVIWQCYLLQHACRYSNILLREFGVFVLGPFCLNNVKYVPKAMYARLFTS